MITETIKVISLLNLAAVWVALIAILRLPNRRAYSAMACYLGVDAILGLPLITLLYAPVLAPRQCYKAYFIVFWAYYLLRAITVLFVVQQVFGESLSPLPGLRRLSLVVFRWIAITSVVIAFASSAYPLASLGKNLEGVMFQISRCVNLMEICMLIFVALSVHTLGLSFSSRIFGVGLGFGLTASMDFITGLLLQHSSQMYSYANVFSEGMSFVAVTIWAVYFIKKEPARQPVTLPVTSPLLRWNEIANALGHKGGQVVVGQPTFFLQDVEKVVDRVLTKNALNEPRAS